MSSNDATKPDRTIESYARVLNHLLRHCATNATFEKDGENTQNYKQGSLTLCNDFQKLSGVASCKVRRYV